MARKQKKGSDEPTVPGWVVTYGDMMSLLLTFFILLLSFATIDQKKLEQAMSSVLRSLGVLPKNVTVVQVMRATPSNPPTRMPRRAERVARQMMRMLQVMGMEKDVQIEYDEKAGLNIELPSRILFDLGRAEVKSEAYEVLVNFGNLLADVPNKRIWVRGHTDNIPVGGNSPFKDNYDLSYYRAKNVMLFISEKSGIPEGDFEVAACGEWQSIAPNDTEEGRQANRRVQFQIQGDFEEEALRAVRQSLTEAGAPATAEELLPSPPVR